jgi:drug/metabolite transporter (DMT)-like permease
MWPMAAVLGGLGAATAWAGAMLSASRASRMLDSPSVLAWVATIGMVITIPLLVIAGDPHLGTREIELLLVAGAGNVGGLLIVYTALRDGPVGLVGPIVSAEGALAAAIAIVAGDPVKTSTLVALGVVTTGVVVASAGGDETSTEAASLRPLLLACTAALSFGASLYATGRLGRTVPVAWAVLPPRLVGVLVVALPLAAMRRLRLTRPAIPLLVVSGCCEVLGFASYAAGARRDVAVAAVLASLFGAVAAIVARFLFDERLTRSQVTGVSIVVAGVVALGVLQA